MLNKFSSPVKRAGGNEGASLCSSCSGVGRPPPVQPPSPIGDPCLGAGGREGGRGCLPACLLGSGPSLLSRELRLQSLSERRAEEGGGNGTERGGSWGLCILWRVCGFFALIACQGNLEGQAKLQLSYGEQSAVERRSGAHPACAWLQLLGATSQ